MTKRRRRILWLALGASLALVLGVITTAVLIVRSDWFNAKVRARMIAEVEKATGGRAELGGFQFDWRTLQARATRFVLHGKEKPGAPPFIELGSVQAGLKIISALEKDVDLDSLIVENPRIHVIVYPDGTTNIPEPPVKRKSPPVAEQLLKLAVRHFELRNGVAEIRDERIPFDLRGDELRAAFDYVPDGPQYKGHLSSRQLHIGAKQIRPVAFDFDADLVLMAQELRISRASFATGRSRLTAAGSVHQWDDPRADLTFESNVQIADLAKTIDVPIEHRGAAQLKGKASIRWGKGFDYAADGRVDARGLAYRDSRLSVDGVATSGRFQLDPRGLRLPEFTASTPYGGFEGHLTLADRFERLALEGNVRGVAAPDVPWNGTATGPVRIDGRKGDFTVQANLNVAAAPGPNPIEGNIDVIWDQRAGTLRLGDTKLSTKATRIRASGTLGETLRATVETSDLDDLKPAIELASPSFKFPIKLTQGVARAEATVWGGLQSARDFSPTKVSGTISLGPFEYERHAFAGLQSRFEVSPDELTVQDIKLTHKSAALTGAFKIALQNWKTTDQSALQASLSLQGGDLPALLVEAGQKLPITGRIAGTAEVTGTLGSPQANVKLASGQLTAWQEKIAQPRAQALITNEAIEVKTGSLESAHGRVQFSGSYRRTAAEWDVGALRFSIDAQNLVIEDIDAFRQQQTGLAGVLAMKATGAARVAKSAFEIDALDSQVSLAGLRRGKAQVGSLTATARTRGNLLAASLEGDIRGSRIRGSGEWKLEGDYPGNGEIDVTALPFAVLNDIIAQGAPDRELPFLGIVDGHATITGPLKKPDALRAVVVLPRVQVNATPNQTLRAGARLQDLALRNTEPVRFTATLKAVDIQSAHFAATDTSLDAVGRVAIDSRSPWDVVVRGRVNLAILQLLNSDIAARGSATLNTAIRGPLNDPQLNGKLELSNASLYLADLPPSVGVDNANGVVVFDRNRANIERLTAEVGGGRVAFGGFIGFTGGVLLYRVQGNADQVRLRHPDGISVTLNAALNLTGTSENGLVSGTITVVRAAFETHTDLGGLLAQSAKPLPAPSAPSEYLRGLNFDVRIESGPNLEVQTSLTRDVEAEAELRLRGNAARPMLAGDISINQGEIQFLGNKYTVNRAEIRFINPTKIEPAFDVDLETKARGITVNISFSGTMNKLNATYRSDPPLQSSDIIALLAVGRDPNSTAISNAQSRTNLLESGASTLSQAVAAPVSNRLQRFFGVSRLKIDPSLTGVENIPQARITLEQQVSRDITLTYITNLTRTQEQIVRVQWDINRRWSAIAVREENGVFGIDFQYRKRFK